MKKITILTSSLVGFSVLSLTAVGVASAATKNPDVGTSGIPKTVFRTERLAASATVLNTTPAAIQAAHKDKTFKQLVSKAGLTRKTYDTNVKTELTKDLEADGYSQDQVTIALQHQALERVHHAKKSSTSTKS